MLSIAHQKAICQHCDHHNEDGKLVHVNGRKLVRIDEEYGSKKLLYVFYLKNSVEDEDKSNMALKNPSLSPKSIASRSLGGIVEVRKAVEGKGEECTIGHGTECHTNNPIHLSKCQRRSKFVETHL